MIRYPILAYNIPVTNTGIIIPNTGIIIVQTTAAKSWNYFEIVSNFEIHFLIFFVITIPRV